MAIKDIKSLGIQPRLSPFEKKIFQLIAKNGASTIQDIAEKGGLTKGRLPASLNQLIDQGLVVSIGEGTFEDKKFVAVFPILKFIEVLSSFSHSLDARKSELEATTEVVHNFTENAIKNVREASTNERQKRIERSEGDVKELEIAMDASFSGILASIEMDLQDLGKIAKTANEFLAESSLRTSETCANIERNVRSLSQNFSESLAVAQNNIQNHIEFTVDDRVGNILDYEIKINKALDEVLLAFTKSQDAFEDIIFNVLDAGIGDLEKVTRPINEQIQEVINSLKKAIKESSNTFQLEIQRVLLEQKRPMITAVESLRPKTVQAMEELHSIQKETLEKQFITLSGILENHASLFRKAVEELAQEFDKKTALIITQAADTLTSSSEQKHLIDEKFSSNINKSFEEKSSSINNASTKAKETIASVKDQFIGILNKAIAHYQLALGDLVAKLENDAINISEKNGTSFQILINSVNLTLEESIQTLLRNFESLNEKTTKDESQFLTKYTQALVQDITSIAQEFQDEVKKKELSFKNILTNLNEKISKDMSTIQIESRNQLLKNEKEFNTLLKDSSNTLLQVLKTSNNETLALSKKLDKWRLDGIKITQREINTQISETLETQSNKINALLERITKNPAAAKNELILLIQESHNTLSKDINELGKDLGNRLAESFGSVAEGIKKDNLSIYNHLVELKKEHDGFIDEFKVPTSKMYHELDANYISCIQQINNELARFFQNEAESFMKGWKDVIKVFESILNKQSSTTSKEMTSLKESSDKLRKVSLNKTKASLENLKKSLTKDANLLVDQERSGRSVITTMLEKTITDLTNKVNQTAEKLRTSLWDGSEKIFSQISSEITKEENSLNSLNTTQIDELIKIYNELSNSVNIQAISLKEKIESLKKHEIGDAQDFQNQFTKNIEEDFGKQMDVLKYSEEEIITLTQNLSIELRETFEALTSKTIQDLEVHTASIEGAIFSTVDGISSEATRRTEGVNVAGEQAVLGIEERYTENLEQIRQKLTDEVISRIEQEAKNIGIYKTELKKIGKDHLALYGKALTEINDKVKVDLANAEKNISKTTIACESLSCKFLQDLNVEIGAMGSRIGISTDKLIKELVEGFDRVLQKVKREVGLFARKQFELSNKSNYEIAEAFLKSVDDLEEVMLKQIASFTDRTNMAIDRTKDLSNTVNEYIKSMSDSFKEFSQ